MRWQVTFTQNHVYEVETDSRIHSYDDYLKLKEDAFDKAYKEGLFTRLYTTNLSYVPKEALSKPWIYQADCSSYVAKIIYTFYQGKSVAPILEYRSKILEDFAKN